MSSLRQGRAYLHRIEQKSCESFLRRGPCKSFKPVTTLLELCVSSLCQCHADLHSKKRFIDDDEQEGPAEHLLRQAVLQEYLDSTTSVRQRCSSPSEAETPVERGTY